MRKLTREVRGNKMNKRIAQILTVVVLMYAMTVMSEASLVIRGTDDLGNKLIYDEDLDITWYDYSHPQNDWDSQVAWGENLSVTYNSMIYDDWRLPTSGTTPEYGYNASGPDNEMEHLYYDEGSGGIPTEFSNIVSSYYWSGTEYAFNWDKAWRFRFSNGLHLDSDKDQWISYALAVRPGDVPAGGVPELPPYAMQMMVLMFGGGLGYLKRKK